MRFQLSPESGGLLDAIQSTDWTRRASYARAISKVAQGLRSPTNLLDAEWDYLVILDAARMDLFQRALKDLRPDLMTDLESVTSVASTTIEWGYHTFEGVDTSEYGYITATPMYRRFEGHLAAPLEFDPLVDLSESPNFRKYGTVPPQVVSDEFVTQARDHPNTAWIVHYLQPHIPFIAPEVTHPTLPAFVTDSEDPSAWELLERGEVSLDAVRGAYLENHRFALREILWLLGELPPGKDVVISSDHGNAFGGWHGYYGHGPGMYLSELVDVPFLHITTGESDHERPEMPIQMGEATGEIDSVDDRLQALGYK